MIKNLAERHDAAGFPVVSWVEHRGPGSVAGAGVQRIECRIMKVPGTGTLLFVVRGRTRNRPFEFGRPWKNLRSFSFEPASPRLETAFEQVMRKQMSGKPSGKILGDGGQALVADFLGEITVDVSCTDAIYVGREPLHLAVTREFVSKRAAYIGAKCKLAFHWPLADDRVETYDPARTTWPGDSPWMRYADGAATVLALVIVAALIGGVLRFVGIL